MASAFMPKMTQVILLFHSSLTFALSSFILLGLFTLFNSVSGECEISIQCLPDYICINGTCRHTSKIWNLDDQHKRQYIGEILTILIFVALALFFLVAICLFVRNCVRSCRTSSDDTRLLLDSSNSNGQRSSSSSSSTSPPLRRPGGVTGNVGQSNFRRSNYLPRNYQSTSNYLGYYDYKNDPPPPYSEVVNLPQQQQQL